MRTSNYDKFPVIPVNFPQPCAWSGWEAIALRLNSALHARDRSRVVMAVDCYTGVSDDEIVSALIPLLSPSLVVNAADAMKTPAQIDDMVNPYLGGNDPVFGKMAYLNLRDFFDTGRVLELRRLVESCENGLVLVYGVGATVVAEDADVLVYADLTRWEAQLRQRRNEISNLGVENRTTPASLQYKRAFFVDWRVCDKHKSSLIDRWDFLLDTTTAGKPKLVAGEALREGLRQAVRRPFRVVPFFDPAPWGGQWMKEVCDLDRDVKNFGWCFDCVPEENSLLLRFGDVTVELPSINLVLYQPRALLGEAVHARFGTEFPIRFDFLDTMAGGNLSFQVHPLTEYIQSKFGMHYTQDESYYLLDAGQDACVYLGLKEGVDRQAMAADLASAQRDGLMFPCEKYANRWPAKKHDHFLIPAGTCHCSGNNAMVLEISATPYIFTFKLWDWGRMGLDGTPRPLHLEHGLANIQWDRTTAWVRRELINRITPMGSGATWREERTGLHEREFIETRRHWFTGVTPHHTGGGVNVMNLVEGEEAVVESPDAAFDPFIVHYAETFIVPAAVGAFNIRPYGTAAAGKLYGTIKAKVK